MATKVKWKATDDKPAYRINKNDIPTRRAHPSAAARKDVMMLVKCVYGQQTSWMFAERGPDYHTRPHQHDAEQMNYVVSGEIWFYVGGRGYKCGPGDVMRIPKDHVHWAWNRGTETAMVIESHAAPLIGNNAEARSISMPLLGPDEDPEQVQYVVNKVVDMDPKEVAAIEARDWDGN